MSFQQRRREQGWSQEQLAEHAGLSVRTIQRIEGGQPASLETLKCLAAVFETSITELTQEHAMYSHQNPPLEPQADHSYAQEHLLTREKEAVEYVQHLKGLYMHLIIFAVLLPALGLLNYFISPEVIWVIYVAIPWSLAIMLQALITFSFFKAFGPQWEQRQFRKRMKQSR